MERALRDLEDAAVGIGDIGELEIGVPESGSRLARPGTDLTRESKYALLGVGEGVGLEMADLFELSPVNGKPLVPLEELLHLTVGNRDYLWNGEGIGRRKGDEQVHDPALHSLHCGISGILVRLAHSVVGDERDLDVYLVGELEVIEQSLG